MVRVDWALRRPARGRHQVRRLFPTLTMSLSSSPLHIRTLSQPERTRVIATEASTDNVQMRIVNVLVLRITSTDNNNLLRRVGLLRCLAILGTTLASASRAPD